MSKFESIPNELLLEVFEYLSSYDIFQAFYFLNQRYNYLLVTLHLRIDLINIYKKTFDYYNYFLFTFLPHRIITFRCEDIFDRLIYQIHLSDFISLKYLTIFNINIEHLQFIIPQLNKLQKLIYLNLQTRTNIQTENKIIFKGQLPLIQKCILNFNQQITFENHHVYSNLEYFTINQCDIEDLYWFLHLYTPQLQHLTITLIDGNLRNKLDTAHHLKTLIINTHTMSFHRLTNSISTLFPYLQRLNISATGIDYTNGKLWQTFLSSNFPQLINFQLHIIFPRDHTPTPNDRTQLLKTFETSYFCSHKWFFALIYHSSIANIELFSLPIIDKEISFHLYGTQIETTKNDENIFKNVKELSLFITNQNENSTLLNPFFPNVQHLKLISEFQEYQSYPKNLFVDISHIVEFSHLKSIEFIGRHFPSASLVLLDYTPNLHSLTISLNNLMKMTKVLSDQAVCHRLTTLIKHLTIKSIDNVNNLLLFDKLPNVFAHLDSLSLSVENPSDLYILMTFILFKMARILKTMNIFISTPCAHNILNQFMAWLFDYMHQRDLDLLDVKLTGNQLYICF